MVEKQKQVGIIDLLKKSWRKYASFWKYADIYLFITKTRLVDKDRWKWFIFLQSEWYRSFKIFALSFTSLKSKSIARIKQHIGNIICHSHIVHPFN